MRTDEADLGMADHGDMSTAANIYSHLDAVCKTKTTGAAMSKALG